MLTIVSRLFFFSNEKNLDPAYFCSFSIFNKKKKSLLDDSEKSTMSTQPTTQIYVQGILNLKKTPCTNC